MKATPTYICVPVYKELTKNMSENTFNSALTINKDNKKKNTAPYINCALAKIEDSFLASRLSDASINNPNTTRIFKRIRRELLPKSYAEF